MIRLALAVGAALCVAGAAQAEEDHASAVAEAAARYDCEARTVRRLTAPHEHIYEVACRGGMIIWMEFRDGAWTLRPIG